MLKLIIPLMTISLSLSAETITAYWDTESYAEAKERLQIDDIEVSDLEKHHYVVTREDNDVILISLADGTEPVDPVDQADPDEPTDPSLFDRTSKQQMLGCLTRWDNQLNAEEITTVLNSLSSMFSDKEKINFCIEDIRAVVRSVE